MGLINKMLSKDHDYKMLSLKPIRIYSKEERWQQITRLQAYKGSDDLTWRKPIRRNNFGMLADAFCQMWRNWMRLKANWRLGLLAFSRHQHVTLISLVHCAYTFLHTKIRPWWREVYNIDSQGRIADFWYDAASTFTLCTLKFFGDNSSKRPNNGATASYCVSMLT